MQSLRRKISFDFDTENQIFLVLKKSKNGERKNPRSPRKNLLSQEDNSYVKIFT